MVLHLCCEYLPVDVRELVSISVVLESIVDISVVDNSVVDISVVVVSASVVVSMVMRSRVSLVASVTVHPSMTMLA